MNSFNKVFVGVQQYCQEHGALSGSDVLQKLAEQAGVPADRIYFYLVCLKDMGLIVINDHEISLTPKGKKTDQTFT